VLRSRVVGRFTNRETLLGPFTATESVTRTGKILKQFTLSSQTSQRVSDSIAAGQELTVVGKAKDLKKTVAVTVYDDFRRWPF